MSSIGRLRGAALISVIAVLLLLTVYFSRQPVGFATPAACLDVYREAMLAGDIEKYHSSLADPFYASIQRRHSGTKELADSLRQEMKDVKAWIQLPQLKSDESTVQVDVEEVRIDGNRRIPFRLQRFANGWLIVGIDEARLVPVGIPYGTHVSKVPEPAETPQR